MGEHSIVFFQKDKNPKYQKFLFLKRFRKGQGEHHFLNIIKKILGGVLGWCGYVVLFKLKINIL